MSGMKLITVNPPSVVARKLTDLQSKQLPFAMAKSMTETAKQYQGVIQARANKIFTVRTGWNKQGNKYGFRVRPATKSHWEAVVWSQAPFIVEHEGAQTRRPRGRHFAIPTENVGITRRGLIPKGQRPRNNPKLFKLSGKANGLYQRKRGKLVRMYSLATKAKLPRDLGFTSGARKFIPRAFRQIFIRNLRHAIQTAR